MCHLLQYKRYKFFADPTKRLTTYSQKEWKERKIFEKMARASMSAQCCDNLASYMDGVHVKIAEGYKPPRKVTLPAAYNNKLPDISKHAYDFSLEKSVLDKVREWRSVRQMNTEVRRLHLEERKKRKNDDLENERRILMDKDKNSIENHGNHEELRKDSGMENTEENRVKDTNEEQNIPVKIAPAPKTTILTPQRLSPPVTDLRENTSPCNGGLDYADFDNDTSSPFDNMELKTINDMEELAQVLQPTSRWIASEKVENIIKELSIENTPSDEEKNDETPDLENRNNNNGRNVSIIVEELERELARPYMENWKPWPDLESPECEDSETEMRLEPLISPKESNLPNPLSDLTEEDKKLAHHLSDMGFPLSRAARAVRDIGRKDNKKVVEYLLAVQYLEELGIPGDEAEKALVINEYDQEKAKIYHENLCTLKTLGFPEDEASKALIKCDIDRDRALDFLIA